MKKNLHIILIILVTPFVLYLMLKTCWTFTYCLQLSGYDYDDLNLVVVLFKMLIRFSIVLAAGVLGFFLLKKFVPAFQNKYLQVGFIVLLYIIISYPIFAKAIQNSNEAEMISGICDKSSGNQMQVKSSNVIYSEYKYLQERLVLLPDISAQSDSIEIDYYHDGFRPDFSLQVTFRVPINDRRKTDGKHWVEKSRDGKYKWIQFTASEN